MKIFTSLLLLFCLITLGLALPRHKRENVEIIEEPDKLDKTTESEIKNEDKLPLLETPSELQSVQEPEPKITKLESVNEPKNPNKFNYASLQSQIIATNILKDNIENRGNEVFSPLGISTILAILAEGSQDESYQEFKNALGYPDDKMALRESFLDILKVYKQNDYDSNPSFKTWFYIYRNNSANDEFKDIIRKYYTAEVKEIDDIDFDWDKPEKSASVANEMKKMEEDKSSNAKAATSNISPSTVSVNSELSGYDEQSEINNKNNSKDIIGFEDLKKSDFFEDEKEKQQEEIIPEITESQSSSLSSESESRSSSSSDESKESTISVNTENALLSGSSLETDITNPKNNDDKMILIKETTGINENLNEIDDIKVIEMKKEASKFDVTVDDKEYVEVPIIKAEIAKENDEKRKREEKESALEVKDSTSSSMISETTPSKESKEETIKSNADDDDDEKKEIAKESNVLDEVLKEIKAEKVALNEFLKKETNQMNDKIKLNTATEEKKLESDAEIAAAAVVDELNKEEKIMEKIILMKEPVKEIEVPMENSDTNQIRRIDLVDINDEENETISQDEKIDVLRKHNKDVNNIIDNNNDNTETVVFIESKEPEKITLSIKKFDDENGEIMEAVETRFIKQRLEPRSLLKKDDITSALSANSISGRENPSKTKMLLFNGLYYRGNWAHPFMELRCDTMDSFTTTEGNSIPIKMMKTRGSFRMAKLDSLDSDALELPYENERFSFVVIVPKQYDGIDKLIEKLQPVDLQMIQSRLTDTLTTINLPKFEIEQTSRSEKTIKRLGISKIFSPYASSMTKMSDEPGLHVEEIVQHVNLRVDEGAASENALSASNSLGRAMSDEEKEKEKEKIKIKEEEDEKHFDVNRPFLYFVMDRSSNFIIAAGKLLQPQIKEEFGFES